MAGPSGLVRFTVFSVSLNFLSLYSLNIPSGEVPDKIYSTWSIEEVIVTSAPLHDTLTPVGREETVALFPEYLIVTVEVNVAFSTKSSGSDSSTSLMVISSGSSTRSGRSVSDLLHAQAMSIAMNRARYTYFFMVVYFLINEFVSRNRLKLSLYWSPTGI